LGEIQQKRLKPNCDDADFSAILNWQVGGEPINFRPAYQMPKTDMLRLPNARFHYAPYYIVRSYQSETY
jgi:hypothetical protein